MNDAAITLEHTEIHTAQPHAEPLKQFLTFTLGDSEYGVDIMQIREVKAWEDTTRLPSAPDYIRGVLNLRGMILPIIDLRTRFSGKITDATRMHVIVIIAVAERVVGVLADAVSDIITVPHNDIRPAPNMEGEGHSRFIDGLIAQEERMVILLNMERLISKEIPSISAALSELSPHGEDAVDDAISEPHSNDSLDSQ